MPAPNPKLKKKTPRHRFLSPLHFHHVSSRTVDGRFAFHIFDPLFVELAWGIVAYATQKYGVRVAAFVLMSNHMHALVKSHSAVAVSRWKQYVKSRLARLANFWCGRSGRVWGERFRSSTLLDEASEAYWFRYILSHGPKEGLVASPVAWPGLQSAGSLLSGAPIQGLMIDRAALAEAEAARAPDAPEIDVREHCTPIELRFSPLTAWERRPLADWRRHCEQTIGGIVADHAVLSLPTELVLDEEIDCLHIPARLERSRCHRFDARGAHADALKREAYAALSVSIEHAHQQMFALVEAGRPDMRIFSGLQWPTAVVEPLLPGPAAWAPMPAAHCAGRVVEQAISSEVAA